MDKFLELRKKYGNFLAPAFKLEIEGEEIQAHKLGIGGISIDLSTGETASACRFTATSLFAGVTRQVSEEKLNTFQVGSRVKAYIGYGSALTPVFYGYIANLAINWSDEMSLSITCLDVRSLMRKSESRVSFEGKTIPDAIELLLTKYDTLLATHKIAIEGLAKDVNATKSGSDLEFICNAAKQFGATLILDVDELILDPAYKKKCVKFDWDDFELQLQMGYLNTKYTVTSYDMETQNRRKVSNTAKQSGNQSGLIEIEDQINVEPSISQEAIEMILKGKVDKAVSESITGSATCAGLPELKPGGLIKINKSPLAKLGLRDGSYKLISVQHKMDMSGFLSTFEIGGVS